MASSSLTWSTFARVAACVSTNALRRQLCRSGRLEQDRFRSSKGVRIGIAPKVEGSSSSHPCHETARSEPAVMSAESGLRGLASASTQSISMAENRVFNEIAIIPSHLHAYTSSMYSGSFGRRRLTGSPLQNRVCSALWLCSQREREAPEKLSASCLTQTLSVWIVSSSSDRGSVCDHLLWTLLRAPALAVSVFHQVFLLQLANLQVSAGISILTCLAVANLPCLTSVEQWAPLYPTSGSTVTNSIVNSETSANQIFLNPASHTCDRVSDDAGSLASLEKQNPLDSRPIARSSCFWTVSITALKRSVSPPSRRREFLIEEGVKAALSHPTPPE